MTWAAWREFHKSSGPINWDGWKDATLKALADPQPGDVFEEMLSYWCEVVGRSGDQVQVRWTTVEKGERCWTEANWMPLRDFERRHLYGTIPGSWVSLHQRAEPMPEYSSETAGESHGK